MAALTKDQRSVERYLHGNPVGITTEGLLGVFRYDERSMKKILRFLRRHKLIKREEGGYWKHTNWLNKK